MKKKTKSILIAVSVIVGIFAVILAILLVKRSTGTKPINVYSVSALMQEDYEGTESNTSGTVRSEGFQKFDVSDTQIVKEIFVEEGQQVKAGDRVLAYDTTLSELDVEKADLNVQKLNLDLTNAQNELAEINSLVPHYEVWIEPKTKKQDDIVYTPVSTPYLMMGKGTKKDPMYWLIDEENTFDLDFFHKIMPKNTSEVYVVLVNKEHSAVNGQVLSSFGLYVKATEDSFSFRPFDADIPEEVANFDELAEPEEGYYESRGSDYTAKEIAEMQAKQLEDIKDIEVQIKVAELELEKLKKEVSDDAAVVKEDGVVTAVRNPEDASKEGLPVVEISSGGGFYIDVFMSELELGNVHLDDTVMINSYSGTSCEGKVIKISDIPAQNSEAENYGNSNVSYYPFTVFAEGDSGLQDGDYASITYTATETEDPGFYLENMFIRKENGESYVYIENAEGLLQKQTVQTGKSLWGMYTQIKDGLTVDDHIAFPYGKDVKEGAKTTEAGIDELYSW